MKKIVLIAALFGLQAGACLAQKSDALGVLRLSPYDTVVGSQPACSSRSLGSYNEMFEKNSACKAPENLKECVLSVTPMDKRAMKLLASEYGPDLFKTRFFDESLVEKHCGWKPGTIHAAFIKSLKEGGYTEKTNEN